MVHHHRNDQGRIQQQNRRQLARRRALADAVAGVIASLVSLWTFYPVDVIKTNLQAGAKSREDLLKGLFRGWFSKSLHTASSSFCYFFLYSWILSNWKQYHQHHSEEKRISAGTRLFLSALAACLNTCLTLPLDVIASKRQTAVKVPQEVVVMSKVWDEVEDTEDSSTDEKKDDSLDEGGDETNLIVTEPSDAVAISFNEKRSLGSVMKFWKGLMPSLLLCSNPSINYTVFDMAKQRLLANRNNNVTMTEAFVLGLFSKFVATIATYPLIRAKVMLMVTSHSNLIQCLASNYRNGGVMGLYKGCDLQLLHTLLKSALMMMVKERISLTTYQLLVPPMSPQG